MPILAAAVTFLAIFGAWQRQQAQDNAGDAPTDPGGLFLASQAAGTPLTGAGRTRGMAQPCTAWLLDTGAPASATAYAVTAGRCVGALESLTVISDEPRAGASIDLNDFARVSTSAPPNAVPVAVDRVEWASARWTDLAILRLGATYGELAAQGISAIRAGAAPSDGTEILVASVPVEGIDGDQQYLRGSQCTTGATTDVLEDGLLWRDARGADCAGILTGSAGAPVFNPAGEAVALVTTTTIGAAEGPDCGPGRACAVRDGGVQPMAADTTYVLPVAGLDACFADGEFTLGGSCPLEDPATVVRASTPSAFGSPGSTAPVRLDPTSPVPSAGVADRSGPMGQVDCFDPEGWSSPVAPDEWSLDLTLPESGWMLACIGSPEQPSPVVVAVGVPGSEA